MLFDKLREVLHNINMMLISAKEKLVELREVYPNLTEVRQDNFRASHVMGVV